MSDELSAVEAWVGVLLAKLAPGERRKLNQSIARDLRRSQQRRIAAQQNPDGTAYAPRKPRKGLREKTGRVRRKMFTKLRLAKHLKLQSTANAAAISFLGRTSRLARVHQEGLSDKPGRNAPAVQYAQRKLLGFSADDLDMVRDQLLEHLTASR